MLAAPCVGTQWVVALYLGSVVNSDSPSMVEQSQQGPDSSCILLFISCLWLCRVSYAICLLLSLLQCVFEIILRSSGCLVMPLDVPSCSPCLLPTVFSPLGFCSPFLFRVFLHCALG